jgi:hypothetical protein
MTGTLQQHSLSPPPLHLVSNSSCTTRGGVLPVFDRLGSASPTVPRHPSVLPAVHRAPWMQVSNGVQQHAAVRAHVLLELGLGTRQWHRPAFGPPSLRRVLLVLSAPCVGVCRQWKRARACLSQQLVQTPNSLTCFACPPSLAVAAPPRHVSCVAATGLHV